MSDNVILPATGSVVRTVARGAAGPQAQVQVLDIGGENGEQLATPSPNGNLTVNIGEAGGAALPDGAMPVSIAGDPNGDFAGINILEKLVDSAGDLALSARVLNPVATDQNNATILSDAPAAILVGPLNVGQTQIIDTLGYQSVHITTQALAASVTVSNDRQNWVGPAIVAVLTGSNNFASAVAANASYSIAVVARYMRFSATTAGSAIVFLRSTPWQGASYLANQPMNLAAVVGQTAISGGVNGSVAIGGNIAAGAAETANPVAIGAINPAGNRTRILSDANGNLQAGGALPAGYQLGSYNVAYSRYTTAANTLTATQSTINPVLTGGVDSTGTARNALTDTFGSAIVRQAPAGAEQSVSELLAQLVAIMRVNSHYLADIRAACFGQTTVPPGDEPDALALDMMRPETLFSNLVN